MSKKTTITRIAMCLAATGALLLPVRAEAGPLTALRDLGRTITGTLTGSGGGKTRLDRELEHKVKAQEREAEREQKRLVRSVDSSRDNRKYVGKSRTVKRAPRSGWNRRGLQPGFHGSTPATQSDPHSKGTRTRARR